MFSSQMDLYCRLPVSREVLVSRPDEVVLLDRLFRAMSPLEATGSDGNRSIWIRLERAGPRTGVPMRNGRRIVPTTAKTPAGRHGLTNGRAGIRMNANGTGSG